MPSDLEITEEGTLEVTEVVEELDPNPMVEMILHPEEDIPIPAEEEIFNQCAVCGVCKNYFHFNCTKILNQTYNYIITMGEDGFVKTVTKVLPTFSNASLSLEKISKN
jgi:hypothetical protein